MPGEEKATEREDEIFEKITDKIYALFKDPSACVTAMSKKKDDKGKWKVYSSHCSKKISLLEKYIMKICKEEEFSEIREKWWPKVKNRFEKFYKDEKALNVLVKVFKGDKDKIKFGNMLENFEKVFAYKNLDDQDTLNNHFGRWAGSTGIKLAYEIADRG